jgi:hypothetical protein
MSTNFANEKLAIAIKYHVLDVDAVPLTAEASKLARELAQVCLRELNVAGLRSETVENLFTPPAFKLRTRVDDDKEKRTNSRRRSTAKYSLPVKVGS